MWLRPSLIWRYAVTAHVQVRHGDTVPMPGPLWNSTEMRRLLILRPMPGFLDPLELPEGLHVLFLQAVPLYDSEQGRLTRLGPDGFMGHWSEAGVPFWDSNRAPSA